MHIIKKSYFIVLAFTILFSANVSAGPLDLDWTTEPCDGGSSTEGCGGSGEGFFRNGLRTDTGVSSFTQTQFRVSGKWYRQFVMGAPTDPFAQEVIIEAAQAPSLTSNGGRGYSASTGLTGEEQQVNANCPISGGDASCAVLRMGNGEDPLGLIYKHDATTTGTGTGHPRRVVMRQILNDGEFSQEFLKDQFDKKPLITESVSTSEVDIQVQIDMRGSNYSSMDTASPMINTFDLIGGTGAPAGDTGDFDIATDSQISNVTAGRYVYIEGGPGRNALEGQYFYTDGGGYNLYGSTGGEFRDDAQNGGPFADGIVYPEINLNPLFSTYPDLIP